MTTTTTALRIETDDHSLACFLSCAAHDYAQTRVDEIQCFINAEGRKSGQPGADEDAIRKEIDRLVKMRDVYYRCGWQVKAALDEVIKRIEDQREW